MKRLIAAILSCVCLVGCGNSKTIENPVNFYYCTNEISFEESNGVIQPEQRSAGKNANDLLATLNVYLQGPLNNALNNPFPEGTEVISLDQVDTTLYLTISEPFSALTGVELTLACACLSTTALELSGLQAIQLSCPDTLLDGNTSLTITADSLVWLDSTELIQPPQP